jgi:hypothetical protein
MQMILILAIRQMINNNMSVNPKWGHGHGITGSKNIFKGHNGPRNISYIVVLVTYIVVGLLAWGFAAVLEFLF